MVLGETFDGGTTFDHAFGDGWSEDASKHAAVVKERCFLHWAGHGCCGSGVEVRWFGDGCNGPDLVVIGSDKQMDIWIFISSELAVNCLNLAWRSDDDEMGSASLRSRNTETCQGRRGVTFL